MSDQNISMNDGSGAYIQALFNILQGKVKSNELQQNVADSVQGYITRAASELKPEEQSALSHPGKLDTVVNQFIRENISRDPKNNQVITSEMEGGEAWKRTSSSAASLVKNVVGDVPAKPRAPNVSTSSNPPAAEAETNPRFSPEQRQEMQNALDNARAQVPAGNWVQRNFATSLDGVKQNFTNTTAVDKGLRIGGAVVGLGATYYFGKNAVRGTKIDPLTKDELPMSFVERSGNALAAVAGAVGAVASLTWRGRGA